MQPENQPVPLDYLNEIAPKSSNKFSFSNKKPLLLGLICGGAFLLIIIIAGIISAIPSSTVTTERMAARILATQEIVDSASGDLKDSGLRAANSQLSLNLTNMVRDLTTILSKENINIKKIDKTITNEESSQETLDTLEDARLNAVYDRTYAREISYKIQTVINLMDQVYKSTKSSSMKSFIDDAENNLSTVQKTFTDYQD